VPEKGQWRTHRAGLGRGSEDTAKGDIVRTGSDCLAGELQPVVAGSAEDLSLEALSRRREIAVVLAEMRAVGADRERKLDVVVDDERNTEFLRQPRNRLGLRACAALAAVLQQGDAALERGAHFFEQARPLGRDGVQPSHLRQGMNCPSAGRKPAESDCQVNSCAARTASPIARPRARFAAQAEASVQPEP